jgi:hypothetical protein
MVTQGETFKAVWDNLWSDLAKEAIYRLFQVQTQTSLLGQVIGIGGKGKSSSSANSLSSIVSGGSSLLTTPVSSITSGWMAHNGENITSFAPKMHSGGMVTPDLQSDEVVRTLQVGERVLSKDANEQFGRYVSAVNNGGYTTYLKNPELAKQASTTNVQVQQSQEHLAKLDRQNELMVVQNQMLFEMLQKNGNGNNGGVMQPVVMKVDMSEQELASKIHKMRNNGWKV